jgi:hypothetical protein
MLPVWQQLHTQAGDDLQVVSVAVDVQGPSVVRPWITEAGATFPTVVDQTDVMARAFGLTAVPTAFFVGPDRRLVEPPTAANPGDEEQRESILAWVRGESDRPGFARDARRTDGDPPRIACARGWWRLAALALSDGRDEDARAHLERAFEFDPENWLIRKQRWALEHPDRFYDGMIDTDWQHEQVVAGH